MGVFRDRDGGYSNGQLFTETKTSSKRLRELVSGLQGRATCPYDEKPDYGRSGLAEAPSGGDRQVQLGRITLQKGAQLTTTDATTPARDPSHRNRQGRLAASKIEIAHRITRHGRSQNSKQEQEPIFHSTHPLQGRRQPINQVTCSFFCNVTTEFCARSLFF